VNDHAYVLSGCAAARGAARLSREGAQRQQMRARLGMCQAKQACCHTGGTRREAEVRRFRITRPGAAMGEHLKDRRQRPGFLKMSPVPGRLVHVQQAFLPARP
jgi:hypothetical protein